MRRRAVVVMRVSGAAATITATSAKGTERYLAGVAILDAKLIQFNPNL
jgi:hypothetical protein